MKDRLRQIVAALVLISGIGELAVSQIHIATTTKLFATEVGFYLFLFVIFGLTTGFNAMLLKNVRGMVVLVGSGLVAVWSGWVYMGLVRTDVAEQTSLAMEDVRTSLMLVTASIAIYAAGIVLLPVLSWGRPDQSTFD